MNTVSSKTHARTTSTGLRDVVRQLNAHLGPTLVAALTGAGGKQAPIRWAKEDGPTPSTDYERRLRLAHRLWTDLAMAETDHIARAWFIGGNPMLDEATPLTAIREDRGKEVAAAAAAFITDTSAA